MHQLGYYENTSLEDAKQAALIEKKLSIQTTCFGYLQLSIEQEKEQLHFINGKSKDSFDMPKLQHQIRHYMKCRATEEFEAVEQYQKKVVDFLQKTCQDFERMYN